MIVLIQIKQIETFAFMAVLAFEFLTRKSLFIHRKNNGNC